MTLPSTNAAATPATERYRSSYWAWRRRWPLMALLAVGLVWAGSSLVRNPHDLADPAAAIVIPLIFGAWWWAPGLLVGRGESIMLSAESVTLQIGRERVPFPGSGVVGFQVEAPKVQLAASALGVTTAVPGPKGRLVMRLGDGSTEPVPAFDRVDRARGPRRIQVKTDGGRWRALRGPDGRPFRWTADTDAQLVRMLDARLEIFCPAKDRLRRQDWAAAAPERSHAAVPVVQPDGHLGTDASSEHLRSQYHRRRSIAPLVWLGLGSAVLLAGLVGSASDPANQDGLAAIPFGLLGFGYLFWQTGAVRLFTGFRHRNDELRLDDGGVGITSWREADVVFAHGQVERFAVEPVATDMVFQLLTFTVLRWTATKTIVVARLVGGTSHEVAGLRRRNGAGRATRIQTRTSSQADWQVLSIDGTAPFRWSSATDHELEAYLLARLRALAATAPREAPATTTP